MSLRVAIVGVGGMGGCHFDIYKNIKDIELVAACDLQLDKLKVKAAGMDINLYSDYDEMLEAEKPDIVDVSTPTYLHKEMSIKAMAAGADVICEKPMTLTPEDATEMIDAANKYGKTFMIAHVVRFMKAYRFLEDAIRSGRNGKLLKLDIKRISSTPTWSFENWFLDEKRSGGVVLDLAIHDIDYMQNIFGNPDEISGVYYDMKNDTTYISACYDYGDFSVSIQSGWFGTSIPFTAEFCAIFENGYVELKNEELVENGSKVDLDADDAVKISGINLSNADGYDAEIIYFIECIKSGKKPSMVTPESSMNSVKLVKRTLECVKKI